MRELILKSIRIKNFRGIKDSDDIYLNDRIITLAGKNESGKTSILKALEKFGSNSFDENDIPNSPEDKDPSVHAEFICDGKQLREFLPFLKNKDYDLIIEKHMKSDDVFYGSLCVSVTDYIKSEAKTIYDDLNEEDRSNIDTTFLGLFEREFDLDVIISYLCNLLNFGCDYLSLDLSDYLIKKYEVAMEQKVNEFNSFNQLLNDFFGNMVDIINKANHLVPEFIYFDDFNSMIPDYIEYERLYDDNYLSENKGFVYLLNYLDISIDDFVRVVSGDERTVNRKLTEYSKKFSGNFNSIYSQDDIKIELQRDGKKIIVYLYDKDLTIDTKPSQRSKGFRWFFSFLLMIETQRDKNSILLIDEPGLFLHSTAQEDILSLFETLKDNTIIYSTHSPFLINSNNMQRIKLVVNDHEQGTCVKNKYYDSSDFETVSPIIAAIGYNISKSPIGFGSGINIITEGLSDRYYLLSFLNLMNANDDSVFIIPSVGSGKICNIASIAIGWNLNFKILLDHDRGGKDAKKSLNYLFSDDDIDNYVVWVLDDDNCAIENIFSLEDQKYTWQKDSGKDKLLVAIEFYKNVKNGTVSKNDLSEETQNNIVVLMKKLGIKR